VYTSGLSLFAAILAAAGLAIPPAIAQDLTKQDKQYKDRAEWELHKKTLDDFSANNFSAMLTDIDAWVQKYPNSPFSSDRTILSVLAFSGANQPAKAIDAAGPLLSPAAFSNPIDASTLLRLLYAVIAAAPRIPELSPTQIAAVQIAAERLSHFDQPPPGSDPAQWPQTQTQLRALSNTALLHIALQPVARALRVKDCVAAETAAHQALDAFPASAQAAWDLGSAALCSYNGGDSSKAPLAIYEFARAAVIDPARGLVRADWQRSTALPNLERVYNAYHGPDPEGLQRLRELARNSPLPPSGFAIASRNQIERDKQASFEKDHPEQALWLRIREKLIAQNGEEYFASEVKGAALPPLSGVLAGANPECRPTELRVSIPTSEGGPSHPEITLKLEKPLAGKLEPGAQLRWVGIPTAFTQDPFDLEMEVSAAKIDGLKTTPCPPARRARP